MRWLFSFVFVFRERRQAREARRTLTPSTATQPLEKFGQRTLRLNDQNGLMWLGVVSADRPQRLVRASNETF
jgi:hypothetical protein